MLYVYIIQDRHSSSVSFFGLQIWFDSITKIYTSSSLLQQPLVPSSRRPHVLNEQILLLLPFVSDR